MTHSLTASDAHGAEFIAEAVADKAAYPIVVIAYEPRRQCDPEDHSAGVTCSTARSIAGIYILVGIEPRRRAQ